MATTGTPLQVLRRRMGALATPRKVWRPTSDELALLASLDEAGVRTEAALGMLARASRDRVARASIEQIADMLRRGEPFSTALADVLAPPYVVALVTAGERSGRMVEGLRGAADLSRRIAELGADLRRAAVYPAVILILGAAIVTAIAAFVIPPMERTLDQLGGELPALTVLVLRVSALLRDPVVVGLALALLVVVRSGARRRTGRRVVPVAGRGWLMSRIERDLQLAVLARACATMLAAGLPLVDALRTVAETTREGRVRSAVMAEAAGIERGEEPLAGEGLRELLEPVECEMLVVAARSGIDAEQWARLADRRTDALRERIRRTGAVLEPLLTVAVGLVVGGAVLALYLPTFRVLDLF